MRLARGRRGPRPGDVRARAGEAAVPPQRRRPRLLLRALRNTFYLRKRTERRRPRTEAFPEEWEPAGGRSPHAEVEAREVFAAIAALPPDFRDVLVAVDVAGLSYDETARALRIAQGTVMSRLYRARQQVARKLAPDA